MTRIDITILCICNFSHAMFLQTSRQNAYHEDPYAEEFGIKISDKFASVEARVLRAPRLKYHDTGREKVCLPRVGQWNMMNKIVVNGGSVNGWMCINFEHNVPEGVACDFCHKLAQMCQISGTLLRSVLLTKFLHEFALEPILHLDLVSQCCLTKHVFRMIKQYLANVALKINVKVGGSNTVLMDALSKHIPFIRHTIIFGADVTHPHPGEDCSPSFAAVRFSSFTWLFSELLISFEVATGQKLQRIIFCRYTIQKFTCILRWSKQRAILSSFAFMTLNSSPSVSVYLTYGCIAAMEYVPYLLVRPIGFIAELFLWFFEQCRLHLMLVRLLSVPSFTRNLRPGTVALWQVDQLGVELVPEDQVGQGFPVVQLLNLFRD
ncbi:unnamed protein product [Musa textilis]